MAQLPTQPEIDKETGETINPEGRPHLSASAIERYLGCPQQYYLERVLRVRVPRTADFSVGRSAHKAAEMSSRHWLEHGQHLSMADLTDIFQAQFVKEWESSQVLPSLLAEFGSELRAREGLFKQGVGCLRCWYTKVRPGLVSIVAVEQRVRIPMTGGFDLVAVMDLITDSGKWRSVKDYKFTKSRREWSGERWLAANIYAIADAMNRGGQLPDELELLVIRRGVRSASYHPVSTVRTVEQVTKFLELVDHVATAIREDEFPATAVYDPNEQWRCGYCDVRQHCAAWKELHPHEASHPIQP